MIASSQLIDETYQTAFAARGKKGPADHHAHQATDEEMHKFFSGVLNLFGMFVNPFAGIGFHGINVTGPIINNPERQLGTGVSEDMVCFIKQRLPISCITLEESDCAQDQEDKNAHGDGCQSNKGN
jgi:hypothetical protein